MARGPVKIVMATETKSVARDIKSGVVDPLEDMVEALDDVGTAGDKMGDGLTDSMRDAQRATEKLEDSQKDLKSTLERGSAAGFKKVGDTADKEMGRAEQATDEFKKEGVANISEVASSFTGDLDSAIDLVQGTLGGLAGSIPGVGIALAGVGAVAGLFYNQWKEAAAASKERIQEMYDDMLEAGSVFLSKDYIQEQMSKIVTGADGAVISMKNLKRIADDTGISQADLLLAFGGDMETRSRLIDELKTQVIDLQGASERAGDGVASAQDIVSIASAEAIRKLKDQNEEAGKAAEAFNAQTEAVSKLNATQGRTYDDMIRNQGVAYDGLVSIKDAAEDIPKKIDTDVTVNAKVKVDTAAIYSGIQGALDKKRFKVFTDAYSATNRYGRPVH